MKDAELAAQQNHLSPDLSNDSRQRQHLVGAMLVAQAIASRNGTRFLICTRGSAPSAKSCWMRSTGSSSALSRLQVGSAMPRSFLDLLTWERSMVQTGMAAGASSMDYSAKLHVPTHELDWKPELNMQQKVQCLGAATLLCVLVYALTAPATFSPAYAAGMAAIFAGCLWLAQSLQTERMYEVRGRMVTELGERDSLFIPIKDMRVHAKASIAPAARDAAAAAAAAAEAPGVRQAVEPILALHCYHGFGANLYSYSLVQSLMAESMRAVVTSHDSPGFGLTERPSDIPSYFLEFNGEVGYHVQGEQLARLGLQPDRQGPNQPATQSSPAASAPGVDEVNHREGSAQPSNPTSTEAGPASWGTPSSPPKRAQSPVSVLSDSIHMSRSSSVTSTPHDSHPNAAHDTAPGSGGSESRGAQPPRVQRVLVGHSMGGLCAALQALAAPDVAALILVAPAILSLGAPTGPDLLPVDNPIPSSRHTAAAGSSPHTGPATSSTTAAPTQAPHAELVSRFVAMDPAAPASSTQPSAASPAGTPTQASGSATDDTATKAASAASSSPKQAVPLHPRVRLTLRAAAIIGQTLLVLATLLLLQLLRPAIVVLLRVLVRSRNFWLKGLQQAYYNPDAVTDKVVDAYRLPKLVKGWENGMFMFLVARLAHVADVSKAAQRVVAAFSSPELATGGQEKAALADRLSAAVAGRRLPVLVIHGTSDKLVPLSNSLRLARSLPGCELAVMSKTGHMPQEEWPQLFTDIVADFVRRRVTAA